MGLATSVLDAMLNWWFNNPQSGEGPPGYIYVALCDVSGVEVSGGNYARVLTDNSDWGIASGGELVNDVPVTFPAPTGNWGVVSKVKLFDAASGGNELGVDDVVEPQNVIAGGTTVEFTAGNIIFRITT